MRRGLILTTLSAVLMCLWMAMITPESGNERTVIQYLKPTWNHADDEQHTTNSCNCGAYLNDETDAAYDDHPPVFSFPGQTYKLTVNNKNVFGNGREVISAYSSDVANAGSALGVPDGNGAKIDSFGRLTIRLKDMLPAGTPYSIRWRKETGERGNVVMKVKEMHAFSMWIYNKKDSLSTESEEYSISNLTAGIDTRYLTLLNEGSAAVRVDAVIYTIASLDSMVTVVIPNDTLSGNENVSSLLVSDDCDPLVDLAYTDMPGEDHGSEGKIIIRRYTATDNCGNVAHAQRRIVLINKKDNTVISGVGYAASDGGKNRNAVAVASSYSRNAFDMNKALGAPDAAGAGIKGFGKLTVQLTEMIPSGSQYTIHWRKESGQPGAPAVMKVMESAAASTWTCNNAGTISTRNEEYFTTTLTASGNVLYIKLWSLGSANIRIDAITVHDNSAAATSSAH